VCGLVINNKVKEVSLRNSAAAAAAAGLQARLFLLPPLRPGTDLLHDRGDLECASFHKKLPVSVNKSNRLFVLKASIIDQLYKLRLKNIQYKFKYLTLLHVEHFILLWR
jgi:hypothetical protein